MKELEGRIGLLTGGSSGIGYQIANTLADAGATVYAISRTGRVKEGWEESHEGVIHIKGDVTCYDEMKRIVTEVAEEGLDFLFNNAGINKKCRAEVFPMEDYRGIMSVNVDRHDPPIILHGKNLSAALFVYSGIVEKKIESLLRHLRYDPFHLIVAGYIAFDMNHALVAFFPTFFYPAGPAYCIHGGACIGERVGDLIADAAASSCEQSNASF